LTTDQYRPSNIKKERGRKKGENKKRKKKRKRVIYDKNNDMFFNGFFFFSFPSHNKLQGPRLVWV
jgi:hypothetical protein